MVFLELFLFSFQTLAFLESFGIFGAFLSLLSLLKIPKHRSTKKTEMRCHRKRPFYKEKYKITGTVTQINMRHTRHVWILFWQGSLIEVRLAGSVAAHRKISN